MSDSHPQVLVVGAGPTGLLLAAELERRDVPCLLVDALDTPRPWDRATIVHARSLEIFEALGLADRLIAEGVRTRAARFHADGDVLGELDFGASGSHYPFDLGLSEEVTESVLTEFLASQGGAVTRSTRLVGLVPGDGAVTATLEHDGARREVEVEWVVGCDGLHSAVREAAGIEYPGVDIDAPWAVFDATIEGWQDEYDMVSLYLDVPPIILSPLPRRRWRVYLRPDSDESDLVAEAGGVLRRYGPHVTFGDVENPTRFFCHSRVASPFRSGRILVGGDAAHACTPAEGHGMNTGLQDAFNLGWKLAFVCRGEAGDGLLDTYEAERRPVAERIVASGSAAEAAEAMTDPTKRAARDADLRRTFADPVSSHHEAAANAEVDRSYPPSRAVAVGGRSPAAPGRRFPETARVEPVDRVPGPLYELTHRRRLTLLVLGGPHGVPGRVGDVVAELEGLASDAVDAVVGFCCMHPGGTVGRMDGSVADELGVSGVTVLAVRPDRYVGFRDDDGDPTAVKAYLDALVS